MALDLEIATYAKRLPELLAHVGEYVVIHQDRVIGFYPDYESALKAGYEQAGLGPFLVKKIAEKEEALFFTRDVRECPI